MKVLLTVSPNFSIKMLEEEIVNVRRGYCDFTKSVDWRPAPPLGILYIAGSLRQAGHDVQIYDLHKAFYTCRENGYFEEKELADFFEEYFNSVINKNKFDVLGISCLFNVASSTVEEMAIRCKRVSPSTKIVLGGHYPTYMYREVLESGVCDYVVLGEAEKEFVWLNNHLADPLITQKVANNPHIVDLNCVKNPDKKAAVIQDMDSLAMPAWDLLPDVNDYIVNSNIAERVGTPRSTKTVKSATVATTRGCPMRCTFCAACVVHGKKIRVHSIDYLTNHIDRLVSNYGINNLLILDDMFNFSSTRVIEFCNTISTKYGDRLSLEFPNGLAVWKLDEEVIKSLKKVGLKSMTIAVESGSQYVQKHILKKNLDLSLIKEKVKLLKKCGIGVRAAYIVGLVGETLEMMQETVQYALELNIDWSEIKIFTPLAGSELYSIAKENGYLIGDMSEHVFGRCCINTPEFGPEQVKDIQYNANIYINFLNNKHLKEKKYENAEQVFRGLLRNFPNHLFAQWGLWTALTGSGKTKQAEESLKKLYELANRSEKTRLLLQKYHIQLPQMV